MTVKELIEFLKTQDQDAVVNVIETTNRDWTVVCDEVLFDTEKHFSYIDLRNNPLAKGQPHQNYHCITLGYID